MLARATVTGFRCLRDVTVDLGPFNVVIGPNDAGKSSLLDALAAVRRAVEGRGMPKGSSVTLTNSDGAVVRAAVNDAGNWVTDPPREVSRWFDVSERVQLDPERIAMLAPRGTGAIHHLIQSRGQGTAAHLASVALGDRARYDLIQAGIREITTGRVKEVVVGEDTGSGYPMSFRLFDDTVVVASEMSSGLLLYLAFLCLIHRTDSPTVLVVEEPENGLHPLRLHEVVRLLRRLAAEGVQIVATTHSPDLLSACKPEELIVLRRPERESGTIVHRLPKDFDRIAMRSTLGEIWAARGEEGLIDMLPRVSGATSSRPPIRRRFGRA